MRRTATVPLDPLGLRWNAYINDFANENKDRFNILSTNIQSINSKFSELEFFLEYLDSINFKFNVIYYSKFAKDHYLGLHYISRHGYHAKSKYGMYSRTCLFHEFQCCIPNLNNR